MFKFRKKPRTLAVRERLVLDEAGSTLVSSSVGPAGELVSLWSTAEGAATLTARLGGPDGPTFPGRSAAHAVPAYVTTHAPDRVVAVRIEDLRLMFPTVQPLPGGRILVVGARTGSGADHNGLVYDAAGQVVAAGAVGDGIEHVLTTPSGDVWVGYFDEGVYGGPVPGVEGPPPGASGLVRFTSDLELDWRFPGEGAIDDCYALNVAGEAAWACYYSDFPVVRIQNGKLTSWLNDLSGVKALMVRGSTVALFGGYGPDRDRLVVGEVRGDRFEAKREWRLVLPDGSPLPGREVFGRGSALHLFADRTWYGLDLADLPGV